MNESKQTVFVVDDDEEVRDSLSLLLESVGLAVASHASAHEFLDAYDPDRSGCLVLDVRMPGMSGVELLDRLNELHSILPVIIITGHGDVPMAVKAMKAGAVDFLQKPFNEQELLDRVNQALEDDAGRRRELGERRGVLDRLQTLTPRERQVMELIVDGKANKNVAGELGVSQRTVEIHRARVMEKTRASSFAHLVRMALVARD